MAKCILQRLGKVSSADLNGLQVVRLCNYWSFLLRIEEGLRRLRGSWLAEYLWKAEAGLESEEGLYGD
jgi:hypothetical protein